MIRFVRRLIPFLAAIMMVTAEAVPEKGARVQSLRVTILSTMLADGSGLGEWGFAALVEADGRRILFDTGMHRDLVLKNIGSLRFDVAAVPEVVLSHSHSDHVGGLMALRESVLPGSPQALSRVHAGKGIFYPRTEDGSLVETNPMIPLKTQYERTGGMFVVHDRPVQLHPGVWLTGPIPRKHPERNWSGSDKVRTPDGIVEDDIPEDTALVIDTDRGLVVITGCGHAGVVNTIEYARSIIRPARIHALIGGLHLFNAADDTLAWTAGKLREFGVENLIGAHCTGIETVYRLRADLGLDRAHAVVGAVGATFDLGQGIDPGHIAR